MPGEWSNNAEGEPEFRWADGMLRIVQGQQRMHIAGWPDLWAKRSEGGARATVWQPFVPEFRLVAPYRPVQRQRKSRQVKQDAAVGQMGLDLGNPEALMPKPKPLTPAQRRTRAFHGFRFSLPKEVARGVEKFRSHQWPALLMMRHDPGAAALMCSNPVLGFALAHTMRGDVEMYASLKVATMRQRDLLALLDLPDSAGAVKAIRKVPPESVSRESWRWLKQLLQGGDAEVGKHLGHLPSLNLGVLRLLSDRGLRASVAGSLLAEVAEMPREAYEARVAGQLEQVRELRRQMDEPEALPSPVRSVAALEQLLRDTEAAWRRHEENRRRDRVRESRGAFPSPPVPGIVGQIEPLVDEHALREEGAEQDNCVASYAWKVREGRAFIYRVRRPQRCTLSLVRGGDGHWRIGELEISENRPANPTTHDFVEGWLKRYRISA